MREIKFRAFNKKEKAMYDSDFFDQHFVINNGKVGMVVMFHDSAYVDYHTSDDFDVMQYTGLLDKNGKEIWEGDIVEIGTLKPKKRKVVEWKEYDASFNIKMNHIYDRENCSHIVIGNIYENPELLDK